MAAKIGLWIDHRQAVIFTLTDEGADKTVIRSNAEKHIRAADSDPNLKGPFKSRMIPADDRHENEFTEHLKMYYDQILEIICKADAVFIFGPGEAKIELKKQMETNHLGGLIADIATADRMNDNQILAKVCKFFHVAVPEENPVESPHQRMKTSQQTRPRHA